MLRGKYSMNAKLCEALEKGDLKTFEKTLGECPNKGEVLQIGPNPLICQAAIRGLKNFLGVIMDADPWSVTLVDSTERSPLMLVALNGDIEAITLILEKKPKQCANKILFNQADKQKMNVLHLAVLSGNENIVENLISSGGGAGCRGRDSRGLLPLHLACSKGMVRSVALLCETMCAEGGGDVGFDTEGCGPLHLAAKEGLDSVISCLLPFKDQLGLLPGQKDRQGLTALEWAEILGHESVAALLRPISPPITSAANAPGAQGVAAGGGRPK
mmetsp:Transcript_21099/g.58127  ORF Transcript_21099/g.58127 Transcript_21099/m.58127 type:complete len:272 (-) Transcript_21099:236-1051(-)